MITYHNNKLAVNVRDFHDYAHDPKFVGYIGDPVFDSVYEQVVESFWQQYAPQVSKEFGYGDVYSEGRSGGWLVVENPPELDISELENGLSYRAATELAEIHRDNWLDFESRIEAEMSGCREDIIVILNDLRAESAREKRESQEMACRDIPTV